VASIYTRGKGMGEKRVNSSVGSGRKDSGGIEVNLLGNIHGATHFESWPNY
jgi:hypothetical protein